MRGRHKDVRGLRRQRCPARLQLAALPFYCILAGYGLSTLIASLERRLERPAWVWTWAGIALLAASIAVWPGAIGRSFTPQLERRFIVSGITRLEPGCTVLWPMRSRGSLTILPTYLSKDRGPSLHWAGLLSDQIPSLASDECYVYYRPTTCYDLDVPDEKGGLSIEHTHIRAECLAVEIQLDLEPIFVRDLAALPDNTQIFSRPLLQVGFYRIKPTRLPRDLL